MSVDTLSKGPNAYSALRFLANACRKRKLALLRLLASYTRRAKKPKTENVTLIPHWPCQHCRTGILRLIGVIKLDATPSKVDRKS